MAYRSLIFSCLFLAFGAAHATYRPMNPPPGWSNNNGTFEYVRVNGQMKWVELSAYANGSLNIGGRSISIPAAMKIAAKTPLVTAFRVFGNPWVAGGVMVAEWLAENALQWNEEKRRWETPDENAVPSDGKEYSVPDATAPKFPSRELACKDWVNRVGGNSWYRYEYYGVDAQTNECLFNQINRTNPNETYIGSQPIYSRQSQCEAGKYYVDGECVTDVPYRMVEQDEFVDKMKNKTFTDPLLNELPPEWPIPVDIPTINPVPPPSGPAQPTYVPVGDPVPNKNYDPSQPTSTTNQPYTQPGVNIVPRNTTEAPWNVDVQPVDRPQESDKGDPAIDYDPNQTQSGSGGGTGQGGKSPPVQNGKEPMPPGLCDQYPDILACEKLTPPEPDVLQSKPVDFDFQIESGFGGSGVCPSPITVSLGGHEYAFSWDGLCNALELLKPLILAFAWLSAAFILLGREGF